MSWTVINYIHCLGHVWWGVGAARWLVEEVGVFIEGTRAADVIVSRSRNVRSRSHLSRTPSPTKPGPTRRSWKDLNPFSPSPTKVITMPTATRPSPTYRRAETLPSEGGRRNIGERSRELGIPWSWGWGEAGAGLVCWCPTLQDGWEGLGRTWGGGKEGWGHRGDGQDQYGQTNLENSYDIITLTQQIDNTKAIVMIISFCKKEKEKFTYLW